MEEITFNRTKIIATVGPACNSKEMLKKLVLAGADVFRLNFSHGEHSGHKKVIENVREINKELGTHVALLQDLQGPKIRLGMMQDGVVIAAGDSLTITTDDCVGDSKKASTTYIGLPTDVKKNDVILVDDGKIELLVKGVKGNDVITEVVHGGALKSRKGINLPSTNVSAASLTEKDKEDLAFGIANDVDWIALSFVRQSKDIYDLKKRIEAAGKDIRVVAKIEKPEAVDNIDEIIKATDAIMVARGDLGVEIAMEDVPIVQKRIVKKCNTAAKPVIIATQMLESMIENPRPTRAETNDVANAVMDGADTVMLSAETAAGDHPELAVKSMVKTIRAVERSQDSVYFKYSEQDKRSPLFHNDSLVQTAVRLSSDTSAEAIVGMTQSGYTAWQLSSLRPKANIFIFTANPALLTKMNLIWGVRGFFYDVAESTDSTIEHIEGILKKEGHLKSGDAFITMASMPIEEKLRTNMMKINLVK